MAVLFKHLKGLVLEGLFEVHRIEAGHRLETGIGTETTVIQDLQFKSRPN